MVKKVVLHRIQLGDGEYIEPGKRGGKAVIRDFTADEIKQLEGTGAIGEPQDDADYDVIPRAETLKTEDGESLGDVAEEAPKKPTPTGKTPAAKPAAKAPAAKPAAKADDGEDEDEDL